MGDIICIICMSACLLVYWYDLRSNQFLYFSDLQYEQSTVMGILWKNTGQKFADTFYPKITFTWIAGDSCYLKRNYEGS